MTDSTGSWTDVPGASFVFGLAAASTVDLQADGTLMAIFSNDIGARCGFRFLVDGGPLSSSAFGDRAVGCDQIDASLTERWCPWSMRSVTFLPAGVHSVRIQVAGDATSDALCLASEDEAFKTKLWILAH